MSFFTFITIGKAVFPLAKFVGKTVTGIVQSGLCSIYQLSLFVSLRPAKKPSQVGLSI